MTENGIIKGELHDVGQIAFGFGGKLRLFRGGCLYYPFEILAKN